MVKMGKKRQRLNYRERKSDGKNSKKSKMSWIRPKRLLATNPILSMISPDWTPVSPWLTARPSVVI